jgi:predicted nucleotidyltransferase component of viral defense system
MHEKIFDGFILVGGTALSLRLGHRMSADIDLFTEKYYGSVDYDKIEEYFKSKYPYYHRPDCSGITGMGRSCYAGNSAKESVKIDLYYTDSFIRPHSLIENIRMANMDDLVAMKVDIIQRRGRKKDFWDLHELLEHYSLSQMIALHYERYPYSHEEELIVKNFIDFEKADEDFDPVCLRGKYWEVIKADFMDEINKYPVESTNSALLI